QHALYLWEALLDIVQGFEHRDQETVNFLWAAARQQCHNRTVRIKATDSGSFCRCGQMMQTLQQRMPDTFRVDPGGSIQWHLKRKQGQHFVDPLGNLFHTPLPPGPDLRAHIIDHVQTSVFELPGKRQVESWRINQDSHPGPTPHGLSPQAMRYSQTLR